MRRFQGEAATLGERASGYRKYRSNNGSERHQGKCKRHEMFQHGATFDAIVTNALPIAAALERFHNAEQNCCARTRPACDEPSQQAEHGHIPQVLLSSSKCGRDHTAYGKRDVRDKERERQERLTIVGKALRNGVRVPTDTYITGDIPTLLTRLGQVPAIPAVKRP